jgi:hypothetical protein
MALGGQSRRFFRIMRKPKIAISQAKYIRLIAIERIEGLSPYPSLSLFAVPISLVEPAKACSLPVTGEGH